VKNKKPGNDNLLLLSQVDDFNLTMIENLLNESKIPYLLKRRGIGGYFKIAFGGSYEMADIYVSEDDYERSKEITDAYFAETVNISEEEMVVESDIRGLKIAKWIIRLLFVIIIVLIVGAAIVNFAQRIFT